MKKTTTESIAYFLCGTHYFRMQAEELRDAAEFEARVAKKLANATWDGILLHCTSACPWHNMDPKDSIRCIHEKKFGFCRLREARLEVEEELDGA